MSIGPERLTLRNRIVEMFKAGQNIVQIAEALKLPTRTVEGHLRAAGVLQEMVQAAANRQEEETTARKGDEIMREPDSNDVARWTVESTCGVKGIPIPKGLSTEAIAEAIRRGESHRQIAERLGVAPQTIRYHAAKARRLGLLGPEGASASRVARPGDVVVTIHLPVPTSELVALMQTVEQALPQREWSVEGKGHEMRLIGRKLEQETKAA